MPMALFKTIPLVKVLNLPPSVKTGIQVTDCLRHTVEERYPGLQ